MWLQLCPYKLRLHLEVWFLLHLLSCYDSSISVAFFVCVLLPSAWSNIIGDAVLAVLPVELDKGR